MTWRTGRAPDPAASPPPGALHQHRVHHAEARRREGGSLPGPDRHVQGERERGVHGAPALRQLPDQGLQGTSARQGPFPGRKQSGSRSQLHWCFPRRGSPRAFERSVKGRSKITFFWQLVTARAGAEWGERSVCATELLPLEQSVRAVGPQLRYVAPGTRLCPCRAAGGRNFSPEPSPLLVALFWPRWRVDRGGGVGGRSAAAPQVALGGQSLL